MRRKLVVVENPSRFKKLLSKPNPLLIADSFDNGIFTAIGFEL